MAVHAVFGIHWGRVANMRLACSTQHSREPLCHCCDNLTPSTMSTSTAVTNLTSPRMTASTAVPVVIGLYWSTQPYGFDIAALVAMYRNLWASGVALNGALLRVEKNNAQ